MADNNGTQASGSSDADPASLNSLSWTRRGSNYAGYDEQQWPPQAGYSQQGDGGEHSRAAALELDDGSGRTYELTPGSHVIGRGQDSSFRIPDAGVSRRHLEITWDGWTAIVVDLGSTNGTTVNSSPIQTWELVDGDVITIGTSRIAFRSL